MPITVRWGGDEILVSCPVCGTEGPGRTIATVSLPPLDDILVRHCDECGSLKLLDTPLAFADDDAMIDLYVEIGAAPGSTLEILTAVDHDRVRRFLDIGCGYGFTIDMTAMLWGWEAVGVEPEYSGRRGAAELGVTILDRLLPNPPGPSSGFDLVLSSEVLEHVPDPLHFLLAMRDVLAPGGLVLLTTPAAECVEPDWAEAERNAALSPGTHVLLASEAGLTRLLGRAGFDDVLVVRRGMTLYAAAGGLDRLLEGAGPFGSLDPDTGELLRRYLDARRPRPGDASALASGLTTRRLRGLVAAGAWEEVPTALTEAMAVLDRRHGVSLDDPAALRARISAGGVLPPLTLVPIAFSAGMWALIDDRPSDAHDLFLVCSTAARAFIASGIRALEIIDLAAQGEYHAALAATSYDPDEASRLALLLDDETGSRRCNVFVHLVVGGHTSAAEPLVESVAASAGLLSTSDDTDLARNGTDALYALGIFALAVEDPIDALGWFQRCRDAASHGAGSTSTHLVAVADEHIAIARDRITSRRTPRVDDDRHAPVVDHFVFSYWCDAAGMYVDGWASSPDGEAEVVGLRLHGRIHPPLAVPQVDGLLQHDSQVWFAVHAAGSPSDHPVLIVEVGGHRVDVALDLPEHGLPRRPDLPDGPSIEELLGRSLALAPAGPVLALGMREAPGPSAPLVTTLFGDREVVSVDIHPGPGVTLVADVHDLDSVIEPESFALVCSFSVLEHLHAPWVAAAAMARALMIGGITVHEVPWTFPTHSQPNDFWRMSSSGLTNLFGPELGFEVLETTEGPAVTVVPESSWRVERPGYLRMSTHVSMAGATIIARKIAPTPDIAWPLNPELSRRTAEEYPPEALIPRSEGPP